jgi:hypothetical protein
MFKQMNKNPIVRFAHFAAGIFKLQLFVPPRPRSKLPSIESSWSNKRAVSVMVSYVLLISIAIFLSIGVYNWLESSSNISAPINCNEGTSVIIENYTCSLGMISISVRNNGRFSVGGIGVSVGDTTQNVPITNLLPFGSAQTGIFGQFYFNDSLKPGAVSSASFVFTSNEGPLTYDEIRRVRIQPFIVSQNSKVVCQNSVISQTITNCIVNP